jgi:hypothetical protein
MMSTKGGIFISNNVYLYEEAFDDKTAYIEVTKSGNAKVELDFDKSQTITVAIPQDIMDELAIAWCKKRKLQGTLGGPVGNEWGSPDSEYTD